MRKPGPKLRSKWPIGRVPPDDPYENTRDHERIWAEIERLHRRSDIPCPPSGSSLTGTGLPGVIEQIGDCTGWWRMGDAFVYPPDDGAFHFLPGAVPDVAQFEGVTTRGGAYVESQNVSGWSVANWRAYQGNPGAPTDTSDGGSMGFRGHDYTGAIAGNQPAAYLAATCGNSVGGANLPTFGTSPDNAKTVACWMRGYDYDTPSGISPGLGFAYASWPGGGAGGWGFFRYQDASDADSSFGLMFGGDIAGSTILSRPGGVSGQWYFLCATYDGTDIKLYIDGTFETSAASAGVGGTAGVTMGKARVKNGFSDNDFPFNGDVDECMMFRKVLTTGEMNAIRVTSGPIPPAGWIATSDGAGGITWVAP